MTYKATCVWWVGGGKGEAKEAEIQKSYGTDVFMEPLCLKLPLQQSNLSNLAKVIYICHAYFLSSY